MSIGLAVIGCGQWGFNHLRVFAETEGVRLLYGVDPREDRRKSLERRFPGARFVADPGAALADPAVTAVVIATPTSTHAPVVRAALEADKDVLCEKPLCTSPSEAAGLRDLAAARGRILMVGHVFVYNAGIQLLRRYVQEGTLGRLYYFHSTRTNLGPIREDVDVVWDLAAHDVSIFHYILGRSPVEVSARGASFLREPTADLAFLTLAYPGGVAAHVHVSWLDPRKVRQITAVGEKKMALWDDMNPAEPIRLYDKGVRREPGYESFGEFQLVIHEEEVLIPRVRQIEPLKAEDAHFIDCVRTRKAPVTDGAAGFEVVRVLDAVRRSLEGRGVPVSVT